MYEDLISKRVNVDYRRGDGEIRFVKGILLEADSLALKIRGNGGDIFIISLPTLLNLRAEGGRE